MSISLCLGDSDTQGEGERRGNAQSMDRSEHTQHLSTVCSLICRQFVVPQNNYNSHIKDH